jgi:hypothetical protein
MMPLHQRDGWVGVSESEGENAARAWFIRGGHSEPPESRLDVRDPGWNDEQLTDVDHTGDRILTTALNAGRITVRSFPALDVLRHIDAEDEELHQGACFVGSHVLARLYRRQATVAIDAEGRLEELEVDNGWLVPGADDSWLSVTANSVRRWILV